MLLQALNTLVMVFFRRVCLDFLIHYFNLTVGPRAPEFSQAVLDPVSGTGLVKHVDFIFGPQMFCQQSIGELRAIVREDRMDFERAIRNEMLQKIPRNFLRHPLVQLDIYIFANTVYPVDAIEFSLLIRISVDVHMHISNLGIP